MIESNEYLNQVVQQSAQVEDELRARRKALPAALTTAGRRADLDSVDIAGQRVSSAATSPVDFRITGFWRWKTVVVPPNVYVVHTRRGHAEPLHLGLGISFRYDPALDAFLIIPAAVQTLLINARCISAERQGVLVQAYVQWVVEDVRTAYRKLDFSDRSDPMRIVNVQLREQAEAAIKDKVATMPIDDILSDKQPIIEELTHRLRGVAEGSREGAATTGLGLRIVTVQIKEAVVSSTRLWENLQKPFRTGRERLARLAELETQEAICRQELLNRQTRETAEIETTRRLESLRAEQERETYDREQGEQVRRHEMEQQAQQRASAECAATEKARRQTDEELAVYQHQLEAGSLTREQESLGRQLELERTRAELERMRLLLAIEKENLEHAALATRQERDAEVLARRRTVENDLSVAHVQAQLIARLPEIAQAMPKPEHLRSIQVNGDGANLVTGLLGQLLQTLDSLGEKSNGKDHKSS